MYFIPMATKQNMLKIQNDFISFLRRKSRPLRNYEKINRIKKSNGDPEPRCKVSRTTQLKMQNPSKPKCPLINGA